MTLSKQNKASCAKISVYLEHIDILSSSISILRETFYSK